MLVENTQPCARSIGNLVLIPGNNKVDNVRWDTLVSDKKWARPIKGLVKEGILVLTDDRDKVTQALVAKTHDLELLNSWLDDAKGPVKGAIKKKIAKMESGGSDDSGELL